MTTLPPAFRRIQLRLAREPRHSLGDERHGHDFFAPIDAEGKIDLKRWKTYSEACRVRRFRPGEQDAIGRLVRGPSGAWLFDYAPGDKDDEAGFRFGEERFIVGEYVSIRGDDGVMHTFRVVAVEEI